ncbi:MAG: hypothetical protein ABL901_20010 [Hyphomicrobiaceae bacterium]
MKLDRNDDPSGVGKYALVNMRRYRALDGAKSVEAYELLGKLDALGIIDKGARGESDEFFVIKLKDKYAGPALVAYANAAVDDDKEWAMQVLALASRAEHHPDKKQPD